MLIHHLRVTGLLSFGPTGIDLDLGPLNVLIGANGSGKSNLLEVLSLLRAAPTKLPDPVKEMGGVHEWLWKGPGASRSATIDAVIDNPRGTSGMSVRHVIEIAEHGDRFEVVDERIENESAYDGKDEPYFYYRFQAGHPVLMDFSQEERGLRRESVKPEESILSQVRDPERYPVLHLLQEQYEQIRLYRSWHFGPGAPVRREQSAQGRGDVLADGGENLALVLSKIRSRVKFPLLDSLRQLFDGIQDFNLTVDGGNVMLYLEESGGREIPATRLSDGTLRYLALLAVLLHPEPPPLVAIEEPELGLHPDILPHLAELLVAASERMQLVVSTHSRQLVDALSDHAGSVIVCGKEDGESQIERLDADHLAAWLDQYSLGELWSIGELGGNRW